MFPNWLIFSCPTFSVCLPAKLSNFDKYSGYRNSLQDTCYDYGSMMHYPSWAFATDSSTLFYLHLHSRLSRSDRPEGRHRHRAGTATVQMYHGSKHYKKRKKTRSRFERISPQIGCLVKGRLLVFLPRIVSVYGSCWSLQLDTYLYISISPDCQGPWNW